MSAHLTLRPGPAEHAPFYAGYVAKVPDGHVVTALVQSAEDAARLLGGLPDQVASFAYAPGKWTLREVVQHCTDAERIFACRALRIGRGDTTELPGWNEQAYAPLSGANDRTLHSLTAELLSVREASVTLFEGLPEEAWPRRGRANGHDVTVRAIAWITAGHLLHHLDIIRERYLAG